MPRMTGNHISIGGNGGQYFFIDWQLAGQDVTNNYSAINWQAYFHYNMADAQLDSGIAGLSGTRWDNGGRVKNFEGRFVTRDVILASGSFNIGHNADGTQGLSVSGGVSAYQSGRSAGSQWFSLPTIPRNSQVTTNDSGGWSIGTPLTINTNRKSSSFTHTITIRLGGSGGTVLQTLNSVGDSVVWTPTSAQINTIQNSIPNDNRALIHITQYNNQVGQNSTTQAWTYIRDANPIFTNFTYKDSNASIVTITGNDQVLVKGKSTLEVTVPSGDKMVSQKGANPDYYAVAYDGVSNNEDYSASDVNSDFTNIDTVGSRAILVTAYDSRTNNTRVAKNVQVYNYTPPNIEFEVTRENNFGEDVTIETGGKFDLLPINGVNKNSLTASSLKYRYKEKGAASWGAWANIPFTVTDNGFAGTNQFITLDNTKEFEFEFQIADKFGTVTQATELGAGTPIMFAGRYSDGSSAVGINKVPENGALDVEGDIYSSGSKVVTQGQLTNMWWEEVGRATNTTLFTGRLNLTVDIPPEKVRNYYHVIANAVRGSGGGGADVVQIVINQERGSNAFMQKSLIYDTVVSGNNLDANGFLRIGGVNASTSYFADLTIINIGDAGWQNLIGMAGSNGTVRTGSGRRQAMGGIASISIYSDQATSVWGGCELIVLGHD